MFGKDAVIFSIDEAADLYNALTRTEELRKAVVEAVIKSRSHTNKAHAGWSKLGDSYLERRDRDLL